MHGNDRLSTKQVAEHAGISRTTLLRWLRNEKVPEPDRDRNGWRAWTQKEADAVATYATQITPHPRKAQGRLGL